MSGMLALAFTLVSSAGSPLHHRGLVGKQWRMYHVVAEAMKLAFADRDHWLGDPDFVEVPIGLIDKSYGIELANQIDMSNVVATQHGMPPNANTKFFEQHTTHVAAADVDGNGVALTTTVNTTFGAKYVIPGTGVIMNNQMDDFVAVPGKPNAFGRIGGDNNAVEAKKRPLSSMSPTIVLRNSQPILTVGAAGGRKIITEVLGAIINHLDWEMPIGDAIAQPRLHHQWSPKDWFWNQVSIPTSRKVSYRVTIRSSDQPVWGSARESHLIPCHKNVLWRS